MKQADLGTLLFCSMRYAYGRCTYIVDDVVRIVREHFAACTKLERDNLLRDLSTELGRADERGVLLGGQSNHDAWEQLWSWMVDQSNAVSAETPPPLSRLVNR
jgi:hypothetical protein